MPEHRLQFVHKIVYVLELAIDAGKADIGDLIYQPQMLHDDLADLVGGDFRIEAVVDFPFDNFNECPDLIVADRAFPAGFFQSGTYFFRVKRFATAILLDDFDVGLFDVLIRREASLAIQTLPSTTDGKAVVI